MPSPMGVNGPIMNTRRSPMTNGGSSRTVSTPASQARPNGSLPRAIIHASGVPSRIRTASVTAPDSAETTSGSSAPGADSARPTAPADRCASRAMTGPSSATQMMPATATETRPDTGRSACPAPAPPPGQARGGCPEPSPSRTAPPATAAGLAAQLILHRCRDRAGSTEQPRLQQRVTALLMQREPGRGEHVRDEPGPGRAVLDGGDIDGQRRAVLGHVARDSDRRLAVLAGQGRTAEVDRRRQLDVMQVQLGRLGLVGAGGVKLARLQPGLEGGLVEGLAGGRRG